MPEVVTLLIVFPIIYPHIILVIVILTNNSTASESHTVCFISAANHRAGFPDHFFKSVTSSTSRKQQSTAQQIDRKAEGLIKEFDSLEQALQAAKSCKRSFDETVLRHLKIHLGFLLSTCPKKSLTASSAVLHVCILL